MTANSILNSLLRKVTGKAAGSILIMIGLFFFVVFKTVGAGESGLSQQEKRSDLIIIDSMKFFGHLEEPPVRFYHDLHTEALVKNMKDCGFCHLSTSKNLSLKFMRFKDSGRQETMDIYHNNCIGCHENPDVKKGPVGCRECHRKTEKTVSNAKSVAFNKSLHFRHTEALGDNCGKCHHEYDKKTEKTVYVKGKESSCVYCHKKNNGDNTLSIRAASHSSCVNCHVSKKKSGNLTGPVNCSGCHDPNRQTQIEQVKNPPRLKRKQPDTVLIKTGNPVLDSTSRNRMDFVRFDHKMHEIANKDCKTCHHKALSRCSTCHDINGKQEGGFISLESAMHDKKAEQSCIGCHATLLKTGECAGCHGLLPASQVKNEATCYVCHKSRLDVTEKKISDLFNSIKGAVKNGGMYGAPENVTINKLMDQYGAVDFPHGKIIAALDKNIRNSRLASSFHIQNELVCAGCHHNLPVTKKPSACSTCHDVATGKMNSGKPDLMAAYHIQCMECHDQMKIDKNGCTDCHKKK